MLNQSVLVGRISSNIETKELSDGKIVAKIMLSVPRSYKNSSGEYDTDYLEITLWDSLARNTAEYVKIGDLVGVKGRLQSASDSNLIEIVADKITYLSKQKES